MNRIALRASSFPCADRIALVIIACCVVALAAISRAVAGERNVIVVDDPAYAHAQRLVEIESGRRLNLYCTGKGSPTVVFDSGLGSDMAVWAQVQPIVAARTRACAYDRAGLGFSDPSNRASNSANIVDDLHRLLVAASIKPPYILVGHSYGGMNVRLYADKYLPEVAGMVLIDSAEEDWSQSAWKLDMRQRTYKQFHATSKPGQQAQRECVKAASAGFTKGTTLYKQCIPEQNPRVSTVIYKAYLKRYQMPGYQKAVLSEEENVHDASADQVRAARRWYGAMPLIVLTSSHITKLRPNVSSAHRAALNRVHDFLADQMAALSTSGIVRPVADSDHTIQLSQPDAVNNAILEVFGRTVVHKRTSE